MKLYHGTSTKYLDSILRDGIQPRNLTGVETSDRFGTGDKFLSAPNYVYLSRDSARYALSTPMVDNDPAEFSFEQNQAVPYAPALIEVDLTSLSNSCLRPDDDWVSTLLLRANEPAFDPSTSEFLEALRSVQGQVCADMSAHASLWELCLEHYGSVAFNGAIPPSAIEKVSTLPLTTKQFSELVLVVEGDQLKLGRKVQRQMQSVVLKWMMGHTTSIDDWVPNAWRLPKKIRRMIMDWTRVRPIFIYPNRP